MICRAIPYEGRDPYIFFSYSHKDSDRVYPLLEQMVRDGYRVWYDDGNHPGDDWLENIGQHLNNCHLCLAMMSQNSEESHNCKKEVSFAVQCDKKLMAVMLEEFAMTIGMRLQLSTIHYLVKNEYPSDKALLEKLYETDSMRACRAVPGSLPMRTFSETAEQKTPTYQNSGALQTFVKETVQEQPKEATVESQPVPEVQPVKNVPKAKTLKVKAKMRPVKKIVKQEAKTEASPMVAEPEITNLPNSVSVQTVEPVADSVPQNNNVPVVEKPQNEEPKQAPEVPAKEPEKANIAEEVVAPVAEQPIHGKILLLRLADGTNYISDKDSVQVGRSDKRCDFVIKNNHLISNHHVNILLENGTCYLQDAGSSNGTFLNGERLQVNSKVQVRNAVKFQICKEEFMLFFGAEVGNCAERREVAYLRNPATESVRILPEGAFPLDRQHKWEDGSLSNGNISRKHAQIYRESDGYYLEDLGSKNGTYCNEQRLASKAKCRLASGDKIRLVDTVLEMNIVTF